MTFDDQNPKMKGYTGQVTLKGYDNMTGLGAPDGPNFIAALRKLAGWQAGEPARPAGQAHRRYTPVCAISRPDLTAAVNAS